MVKHCAATRAALGIHPTLVAGTGHSLAISATTRALLHDSTVTQRAPIFSVVYVLYYTGATIPRSLQEN